MLPQDIVIKIENEIIMQSSTNLLGKRFELNYDPDAKIHKNFALGGSIIFSGIALYYADPMAIIVSSMGASGLMALAFGSQKQFYYGKYDKKENLYYLLENHYFIVNHEHDDKVSQKLIQTMKNNFEAMVCNNHKWNFKQLNAFPQLNQNNLELRKITRLWEITQYPNLFKKACDQYFSGDLLSIYYRDFRQCFIQVLQTHLGCPKNLAYILYDQECCIDNMIVLKEKERQAKDRTQLMNYIRICKDIVQEHITSIQKQSHLNYRPIQNHLSLNFKPEHMSKFILENMI